MPGIDEVPVPDQHLDDGRWTALPEHLIVVGGSYIGLEFAQMYRRFGSRVTVVEMGRRLIAREDADVSTRDRRRSSNARASHSACERQCIGVERTAATTSRWRVECAQGAAGEVEGRHLLLAVGRRPNTDDLGLDTAGIATDARGFIRVDDQLRTNVPGIWAIGDCNGRGAFTHTSYNDFEIVAANLLDGEPRRVERSHPGLCAVHRPAARPRRHDRDRGAGVGPTRAVGDAADEPGRPRARARRDAGLHEDRRRRRHADASSAPRCSASSGDEVVHRCSTVMYAGAPTGDPARRAHPPDGQRADPDAAGQPADPPRAA